MPHFADDGATACVLNGRLHVIGGSGYTQNIHQVLETTEQNGFAWTQKADLPAWLSNDAIVVHANKIVVLGGNMGGTYDAEADAWEMAPPLPLGARSALAATSLDGRILLCSHDVTLECGSSRTGGIGWRSWRWSEVAEGTGVDVYACGCVLLG